LFLFLRHYFSWYLGLLFASRLVLLLLLGRFLAALLRGGRLLVLQKLDERAAKHKPSKK
jgi:hypothetical protein